MATRGIITSHTIFMRPPPSRIETTNRSGFINQSGIIRTASGRKLAPKSPSLRDSLLDHCAEFDLSGGNLATQKAAGKKMAGQKKKGAKKERTATPTDVLRHPLRIRILEVLNERDMSPVQFMNSGLAEDAEISQGALSTTSYHFRELQRFGCLALVDTIPRRGATEHVYRGTARAYFTDEEWKGLSQRERCVISRTMYSGMAARVERAMVEHTFDSRVDRHLTWLAMELDEDGWSELMGKMASWFGEVVQIRHDAAARIASDLKGKKGSERATIPVTFGMLGFESPPLPPLDALAKGAS